MIAWGLSLTSSAIVVSREPGGGASAGVDKEFMMAWRRETRSTLRVLGYEMVKIGSKMAARYKQSMGEVCDEAMMVPGEGNRGLFAFIPRELSVVSTYNIRSWIDQPSSDTIDLKIYPPYPWRSQYTPQYRLFTQGPNGKPLQEQQITQGQPKEDGQSDKEEKDV